LKVPIADEERNDGIDGSATKGVVAEVYLDEVLLVDEGVAERGKCLGNLRDQATCEYVRKVGDLERCVSGTGKGFGMQTLMFSALVKKSPIAFDASTPNVFPPKRTSSTFSGSTPSSNVSTSPAVSSFSPRPCHDKIVIFVDIAVGDEQGSGDCRSTFDQTRTWTRLYEIYDYQIVTGEDTIFKSLGDI
jgi:hypothetical protein